MRNTIFMVIDITRSPTVGYAIIGPVPEVIDRGECLDDILWDRLLLADHLHAEAQR